MAVIDGRTGLEMVPVRECWRLLEGQAVGRIAVCVDGQPEIMPVNYTVLDHAVVFRTEGGTKLRAIEEHEAVAFEVDETDPHDHSGWSVLVKGRAEHFRPPVPLRHLEAVSPHPWASGHKPHWIRIVPHEVTGRRIINR